MDQLSGGRFILGVGIGWAQEEFKVLNVPYRSRGAITNEYLEAVKLLWTQDVASYDGKFVSFKDVHTAPQPIQTPHPPIWVGGESNPALRRAAELGDCWYPIGTNPKFPLDSVELLGKRIEHLHHYAESNNRDPATIDLAYSANWFNMASHGPDYRTRWFEGESGQIQEDIGQLMDLGVNHLILSFTGESTSEITDKMSMFTSKVATNITQ